jgi:DNA polymerase sigma
VTGFTNPAYGLFMKIEAAESLFLSWLRHVKECQLVQTNWKPSPQWERKNEEALGQLMQDSSEFFKSKYNYDLYKGTKGVDQLLKQAEIDVIGVAFDEGKVEMYAIDVAFHEAGLNYGSKEETIARIIKKMP